MEQVNLNRQVFNKEKFNETIDTSFTQLGPQVEDPSSGSKYWYNSVTGASQWEDPNEI